MDFKWTVEIIKLDQCIMAENFPRIIRDRYAICMDQCPVNIKWALNSYGVIVANVSIFFKVLFIV